jgi:opacity protein-like surface antigen
MYRVPIAIALTLAFAAIHADSVQILEPVNQHRLNFSLLQVGYDYLVKDSFYTGAHACITPIWDSNAHNIKTTDYFCSFEARIGRNFGISHKTSLIPYAAIGFNNYHRENVGMYLKKQTYVAFGLKYNHEFGPIFESGVGVKAISSFKNVYADTEFEKRDVNTKKLLQFNKVNSDKNY